MKRFLVVWMLAGCVELPPPQPSPAVQQLQSACNGGDTDACTKVAELEQRERERRASISGPIFTPTYNNPSDFMNNGPAAPPTSGMKVCPNGLIVQQYYLC